MMLLQTMMEKVKGMRMEEGGKVTSGCWVPPSSLHSVFVSTMRGRGSQGIGEGTTVCIQ